MGALHEGGIGLNAVKNHVRNLVEIELAAANERFPQFHSQHEGWAVILEEQVELGTEFDKIKGYMGDIFNKIIENNPVSLEIGLVQIHAVNAACEAIQVAAMCQKFLEMDHHA